MTRNIPTHLAPILEKLELEKPSLVSMQQLEKIVKAAGIKTEVRVVASRLRERGWLLATPQAGIWEFAPAELAGPFPSLDPFMPLQAYLLKRPAAKCAITLQTAAWARGFADRVPPVIEVAFSQNSTFPKSPAQMCLSKFTPKILPEIIKGVPVLTPESIIVQMSLKPSSVRSWESAFEWLPELAYEADAERIVRELLGRSLAVAQRCGYLLQGMRPDLSRIIHYEFPPKTKVRFGSRSKALRNDEYWLISDPLLPFNPKEISAVKLQ